jgi:hypothetical protein
MVPPELQIFFQKHKDVHLGFSIPLEVGGVGSIPVREPTIP